MKYFYSTFFVLLFTLPFSNAYSFTIIESQSDLDSLCATNSLESATFWFADVYLDSIPDSFYETRIVNLSFTNVNSEAVNLILRNLKQKSCIYSLDIHHVGFLDPNLSFEEYTGLQKLSLRGFSINSLDKFANSLNITALDIAHSTISIKDIDRWKYLKKLSINNVAIENINTIFTPSLETLILRNLKLKNNSLDSTIKRAKSLSDLNVDNTEINGLDKWISSLNKIEEIELINLKNLNIHNFLKNLYKIKDQIKSLAFINIPVESLPEELFDFENLYQLYIKNAGLKKIPNGLNKLKNLRGITLSHNFIKNINIDLNDFKKLVYINLSNNHLRTIPFVNDKVKKTYITIYIQNNKINPELQNLYKSIIPNIEFEEPEYEEEFIIFPNRKRIY